MLIPARQNNPFPALEWCVIPSRAVAFGRMNSLTRYSIPSGSRNRLKSEGKASGRLAAHTIFHRHNIVNALSGFGHAYISSRFPLSNLENAERSGMISISLRSTLPNQIAGIHRCSGRHSWGICKELHALSRGSRVLKYCFKPSVLIFFAALTSRSCTAPHLGQVQFLSL